ncbi:MAG: hypothetical protein ACE5LU_19630, partial [Anaerolineae bacterium]
RLAAQPWQTQHAPRPGGADPGLEERIGRLEAELRETLTVASVEGEAFTAEVVAQVRKVDERSLVRQLGRELDKKHHLVGAQGIRRLGRQRLSLYRFWHSLFQWHVTFWKPAWMTERWPI